MKGQNKNVWLFSILVLVSFLSYGLMATQTQQFMRYLGMSISEIALLFSGTSIVAMILQVILGYLSDKFKTIKMIFRIATVIFMVSGFLVYSFGITNQIVNAIEICVMVPFTILFQSMIENWILQTDDVKNSFGRIRVFGSLGWAIGALASGYLVKYLEYSSLGIANILLSLYILFVAHSLEDANKESDAEIEIGDVGNLFHNAAYILLILAFTCAHMLINVDSYFANILITQLNGASNDVGIYAALYAAFEIPTMMMMDKIYERLGEEKTFLVGALSIGAKFLILSIASKILVVQMSNACQLSAYPFILVSQKFMISHVVPKSLQSTGLSIADSIFTGLSAIIAPIMASGLIENYSIRFGLRIFSLFALLSILFMLILHYYRRKEQIHI